jgi:hypothetical protein
MLGIMLGLGGELEPPQVAGGGAREDVHKSRPESQTTATLGP